MSLHAALSDIQEYCHRQGQPMSFFYAHKAATLALPLCTTASQIHHHRIRIFFLLSGHGFGISCYFPGKHASISVMQQEIPADLVCTRSQDSTTACVDATDRHPLRPEVPQDSHGSGVLFLWHLHEVCVQRVLGIQ